MELGGKATIALVLIVSGILTAVRGAPTFQQFKALLYALFGVGLAGALLAAFGWQVTVGGLAVVVYASYVLGYALGTLTTVYVIPLVRPAARPPGHSRPSVRSLCPCACR